MKHIIFILAISGFNLSYGQQLPGDSLVSDFKYFVNCLEATHPDPYSAFGNKILFHKSTFDIEQSLKNGASKEQFANTISAFLSTLEDGHTRIFIPAVENNSNFWFPLDLTTYSDGLMVIASPEQNKELIGCKIKAVNKIPVDTLLYRIRRLAPAENIYGAYRTLERWMNSLEYMKRLISGITRDVVLELEQGDKILQFKLSYLSKAEYDNLKKAHRPQWSKISDKENEYMYFDFLDADKQAMLFRLASVQAREQFLFMKNNKWPNFQNTLEQFYKNYVKQEMPENQDIAIEKIPALSEVFRNMLEEMKNNQSKYLVIDLRDNGGGWTPIVPATLYQLYGDKYLEKDMNIHYYRIISPLYMQKLGTTLEEYNANNKSGYHYGDYTFSEDKPDNKSTEEIRNNFVKNIFGGISAPVSGLNGQPVYQPEKVFVITNTGTFSAAFHYAFYLWKMGATVVGVPSEQAPDTFMENTEFKLPYTGLEGTISNSVQIFLPVNDKRAKIFYPDIMLTWNDYRKYDFDKYADVLFLMDYLKLKYSRINEKMD